VNGPSRHPFGGGVEIGNPSQDIGADDGVAYVSEDVLSPPGWIALPFQHRLGIGAGVLQIMGSQSATNVSAIVAELEWPEGRCQDGHSDATPCTT
jgi:hypothetical protein